MQASKELEHKNEFHHQFTSVNLKGIALFCDKAEAEGGQRLIPKTIGNRKRDCA